MTLMMLAATAAQSTVFVVNSTADTGPGSLRQAMLDANAQIVTGGSACAPHEIHFNIPGAGPHTIRPLSALPPVLITITFDGYSQAGATPNSIPQGNNAALKIELDGSQAGVADGLRFSAVMPGMPGCRGNLSVVTGLVINRFQGAAIRVESPCLPPAVCQVGGIRIIGNFIGTDVTGSLPLGNGFGTIPQPGVVFGANSTRNIVGDEIVESGGGSTLTPSNRNVISANALDGIYLGSSPGRESALDHRIRNNAIGLSASGTTALPNGRHGVFADLGSEATQIQDNLISGNSGDGVRMLANSLFANIVRNGIGIGENGIALGNAGAGVHVGGTASAVTISRRYALSPFVTASIANNGGAGIFVDDAAMVDTAAASVSQNAGLELDVAPAGVNPNDPLDADAGPNERLNYPVITSAVLNTATSTGTITGTFNSTPGVHTDLVFFFSDHCDPSGYGGAQTAFNDGVPVAVIPDAQGNVSFVRNAPSLPLNKFITAQARRPSANSATPGVVVVSEYSACRVVLASSELIFEDGFE
ncbi:MAG: hypothetical protein ABI411_16525 [Tahibacter sp.]